MEGAFLEAAKDVIQDIFGNDFEVADNPVIEVMNSTFESLADLIELIADLELNGVKVTIISIVKLASGVLVVKLILTHTKNYEPTRH